MFSSMDIGSSRPVRVVSGHSPYNDDEEPYEEGEMTTVADFLGHQQNVMTIEKSPFVVGTNLIGVEIELENLRIRMPRNPVWEDKHDGSLRNSGREFVLRQPLGGKDLLGALQQIDTYLHDKNPDPSWRCSTHIHLDVRDCTVQEIKLITLGYSVYERLFFRLSGWHRYKNNFCPAFGFAQGQILNLSAHWNYEDRRFLDGVIGCWSKYSALNMLPMAAFGSVEFRISEAKTRKGQLLRLCNRILALKELAKSWTGTEDEFVSHLVNTNPYETLGNKSLPRTLGFDPRNDIMLGAKLALDVMYYHKVRRENMDNSNVDREFVVRELGNWGDISRYARDRDIIMDGIDFSRGSEQPQRMLFSQLHELTQHVPINVNWFLSDNGEDRPDYRLFREVSSQ